METVDLAIVGGGASGLLACICALRTEPSLSVTVLEAADRVGKKLLTTGNGRCNLTSNVITPQRYHGDRDFAARVLQNFSKTRTLDLFDDLSLRVVAIEDKVFPYSLQASGVLDCLRFACEELGAEIRTNSAVSILTPTKENFLLTLANGSALRAKRVIWAVGSPAGVKFSPVSLYDPIVRLGHPMAPIYPTLVQVRTELDLIRPLKGIKVEAAISAMRREKLLRCEQGEVLFADYGISGPPVLQISRLVSTGECDRIVLDLTPDLSISEVEVELMRRLSRCADRPDAEFLTGFLNKRVGQTLFKLAGGERSAHGMRRLAALIKGFCLVPRGVTGWQNAQAAAGGIEPMNFDPATMQSRKVAGLYVCGEVLNVDGDCGGFNLQFAWSTGALAGSSAARSLQ